MKEFTKFLGIVLGSFMVVGGLAASAFYTLATDTTTNEKAVAIGAGVVLVILGVLLIRKVSDGFWDAVESLFWFWS